MKLLTALTLFISIQLTAQTTWYEIPSGTDTTLNTISFGSESVGYIGGNDSLLLKTTDGGLTWNAINYSGVTFFPSGDRIVNLKFINESVGYMTVGPYTGTYKTTDGGQNWTQVNLPGSMCYNQGLYFWDIDNGIIGGSGCFMGELISKMSNGSVNLATISSVSPSAPNVITDVDFANNSFGLAVSTKRFFRTTDGGLNWDTISSGTPYEITSITTVNDTLAYAGYIDTNASGFGILKTHDAGLTWSMEQSMATFYYPDYNDVYHTNSNFIYSGGKTDFLNKGIMFENTGSGWLYSEVNNPINAIDGYADYVFAVGDSGIIVTNKNFNGNVSSKSYKKVSDNITIYPNPTRGVFNLDLPNEVKVQKINILNTQGQVVKLLNKNDTQHSVEELPTGIYFIVIQSNEKTITKKLILK